MPNSVRAIFALVLFAIANLSPAGAGALRDGITAYDRADFVAAAHFLQIAASNGNAEAQTYLGFMFWTGRGVPQNFEVAAHWYRCAAEQGNPSAQLMLGMLYEKGQGVPENYVEAHKWLILATAYASPPARDYSARLRDAVATKMTLYQLAESRARALAWAPVLAR